MSDHTWRMAAIDDDPVMGPLLDEVFSRRGWHVDVFSDGTEASKCIAETRFDVVLLDLQLPGKPGIELLQEIRSKWSDTEVIVVTGYASIDSAIRALELDAYAYITKPFEMADLITSVENAQEKLGLERLNAELLDHLTRNEAELERAVERATLQLEQVNARLQELAVRDGLTGLFNRRYFEERLDDEISRALRYDSKLTLAMLDIDHFKQHNDTYGHLRGDDALMIIASLLQENVRRNDIVARYGGEEFAMILIEASEDHVATVCERARAATESASFPGHTASRPVQLTVSIGYAHCPRDTNNKADLIAFADRALYAAKHFGRNRVCSYESIQHIDVGCSFGSPILR